MDNEERLSRLEKRMDDVEKNQLENSRKIDRMYQGMFGDPKINYEGLIESNKRHTAYLNKIDPVIDDLREGINRKQRNKDRWKSLIKWFVGVVSGLVVIWNAFKDFIAKFIHALLR